MYFIQILLLVLFGLAILVQLYYYIVRFVRVLRHAPGEAVPRSPEAEALSVVICARNEKSNLQRLLPQLMQQQYPSFEVIVVDDCSQDGTKDFLDEVKKEYPGLRSIHIEQTPPHITAKKYALTMGIKHAKNDILVLTDADCLPATEHWLVGMATAFKKEQIQFVLGFSQYEKQAGLLNSFIRYETLHTGLMYLGAALAGRPYMGVGRNLAYRKSFFLEKKGFIKHRTVTGGDDDLFVNQHAHKGNTTVRYGQDTLVYSVPKSTWKEWYRQKLRHMMAGKLYKKRSKLRLGIYTAALLVFWITFVALLSLGIEPYWVIGGFLIRTTFLYYLVVAGSKRLGAQFTDWSILLLDFLSVFYYFFIGLAAFFTKKTTWK